MQGRMTIAAALRAVATAFAAVALCWSAAAPAAEPIKLGFSMALTGGVALAGKQVLAALQIWRDDVNEKGGLLGRPVELVFYDDQSNPSNVPPIYTKLIEIDKVDLVIGPYATNMVAPAIPVVMSHNMTTVGIQANAANSEFHYNRYFSILGAGPEPQKAFSTGFFELAMSHKEDLHTIALIGADAEFSQNALQGARENLKTYPFKPVFDRNYPPTTTDYAPIVRAVQAANPDIVYVAAYPPDSVGIIRAANEIGLVPKLFGGTFIGLLVTQLQEQLGPLMNGLITTAGTPPSLMRKFPGGTQLQSRYQALAATQGLDPLGYNYPPAGYASAQVLAAGVEGAKSLDQDKIAAYIRGHTISTVLGDITFGKDGEWAKTRFYFAQFQHVASGDLDQFRDAVHEPVLWPPEFKTGELIYPYGAARK